MKISDNDFEKLLAAQSAQEIKSLLAIRKMVPSLSQASRLRGHMNSFHCAQKQINLGIIHTYTSELLDPWLHFSAALNQLSVNIYHGPYGATFQEAAENSGLIRHSPDITLLLLTREDLHPAFQSPIPCIKPSDRSYIQSEFQAAMTGLIRNFRGGVDGQIIVTFLPAMVSPGLGMYDAMSENSETYWWNQIKTNIASSFRDEFSGVSFLDLDQLTMRLGRDNFFDLRLWYSSVFPFTPDGAFAVSNAIATLAAGIHFTKSKVIVLDADNTLWGGVLGEDGFNGIALGQDYPGRAYLDFQKRLLSLQQRGFLLALCSKNNPEDVEEVLRSHPHQLLKPEHFAAQRVNWLAKPVNLRSLAEELNLGLDSFIFVDDSDYECSAVRHSLPEVDVIQVPSRPAEIPSCLDTIARLEIVSLTAEDLEKTSMYAQERLRKSQLQTISHTGGSIVDHLKSLNMEMTVGLNDNSLVTRLAQLTQKTNQFNLTTRRYNENDIAEMIGSDAFSVYHFSLADNFGDSGIVGLAIIEREAENGARLDTFLMSCRVIGRLADQAFLNTILFKLKSVGIKKLWADYIPTRKNVLVENFLPENGFCKTTDGRYFTELQNSTLELRVDLPIKIQGQF